MSKIEVGMLVRVSESAIRYRRCGGELLSSPSPDAGKAFIVSRFFGIRKSDRTGEYVPKWVLSGSSAKHTAEYLLTPINPDHEPCGESFSDMLKNLRGVEV